MLTSYGLQTTGALDLARSLSLELGGHTFQVALTGAIEVQVEFEAEVATFDVELYHWEPALIPLGSSVWHLGKPTPGRWTGPFGAQTWEPATKVVDQVIHVPKAPPFPVVRHGAAVTAVTPLALDLEGLGRQLLATLDPGELWGLVGGVDLVGAVADACEQAVTDGYDGLLEAFSVEDWPLWGATGDQLTAAALEPIQAALEDAFALAADAGRQVAAAALKALVAFQDLAGALVALADRLIAELDPLLFYPAAGLKLIVALATGAVDQARAAFGAVVDALVAPFAKKTPPSSAQEAWLFDALQWLLERAASISALGQPVIVEALARLCAVLAPTAWSRVRARLRPLVADAAALLELGPTGQASFAADVFEKLLDQPAVGALLAEEV